MTVETFPPEARLRQSGDFRRVFANGRRYVRPGFVVVVAPGRSTQHARLGLAIAKRRAPRAVDRNRIKRLVRDSFRRARQSLGSVDIVVLARGQTASMVNSRLLGQLHGIWVEVAPESGDSASV